MDDSWKWHSIDFPASLLDRGANNSIEIHSTAHYTDIEDCGPGVDDIGEQNAVYQYGTTSVYGPEYGRMYAKLTVITHHPHIDAISPSTGSIGFQVTISGSNFNESQGSGYVTFFNGVVAPNVMS